MQKRRYEILLPVRFKDGQPVSGELLEQTREELVARFHGLSIAPHTVLGRRPRRGKLRGPRRELTGV